MPKVILKDAYFETDRIRVMEFVHTLGEELWPFEAGAHVDFVLGAGVSRSYSLIDWDGETSAPNVYTFAVQHEKDGEGGSKAMHRLEIGQEIEVTAPQNDFELKNSKAPVLLLAGGIGVTPLISMAAALAREGRAFEFHYAARSRAAMGFTERLTQAFGPQMRFYFDDENPLDLGQLMQAQVQGTQIYICGPQGMITAAQAAAEAAGHSSTSVHVELFTTAKTEASDAAFEVEISDTGEVFTIPPGKTIIEVLEEAGKDLLYDCQRGDCGICQTDVIAGTPDHRDVVLSEADRASGKVMQICVSRAKSARLVLDI